MGLTVKLKPGERVQVGDNIFITCKADGGGTAKAYVQFEAPPEVRITRLPAPDRPRSATYS